MIVLKVLKRPKLISFKICSLKICIHGVFLASGGKLVELTSSLYAQNEEVLLLSHKQYMNTRFARKPHPLGCGVDQGMHEVLLLFPRIWEQV